MTELILKYLKEGSSFEEKTQFPSKYVLLNLNGLKYIFNTV